MFGSNGQLPKGMRLPDMPEEDEAPPLPPEEASLTLADVNYAKSLREALASVKDVRFSIVSMNIDEGGGMPPSIRLELQVFPKE